MADSVNFGFFGLDYALADTIASANYRVIPSRFRKCMGAGSITDPRLVLSGGTCSVAALFGALCPKGAALAFPIGVIVIIGMEISAFTTSTWFRHCNITSTKNDTEFNIDRMVHLINEIYSIALAWKILKIYIIYFCA